MMSQTHPLIVDPTIALSTAKRVDRDELFREGWNTWAQRWVLGTAYALMPNRAASVPALLMHSLADVLRGGTRIPDQKRTKKTPDTFGGICRNLSAETTLEAGRRGFYAWCHCGPLKWWTREQRMVLFFPTTTSASASAAI